MLRSRLRYLWLQAHLLAGATDQTCSRLMLILSGAIRFFKVAEALFIIFLLFRL